MMRRFSNNSWHRRENSMHTPELKAWIAQVLRDAARRPDGVGMLNPANLTSTARSGRVFRETDNEAECRHLAGHGTIFVPKCYEEKYPYPLIVWLNESEHVEPAFHEFLLGLSDRNYLGFSPDDSASAAIIETAQNETRANRPFPSESLSGLHEAVRAIRRDVNIHTERVFVAGTGRGANAALSLFLARPEWFGGAVILDGRFDQETVPLGDLEELRGKRVFLANSADEPGRPNPIARTVAVSRLLNSAGVAVTTRAYESPDPLAPAKLADINEWVMDGVCTPV